MSKKDNVIKFPMGRIKNPVDRPVSERIMQELSIHEECIDLGRFSVDLIEKGLEEYYGKDAIMDLRDKSSDEYKDMFVILNLLVSMFMRKAGLHHILQEDLTDVYMKLKFIEKSNPRTSDNDEIDFDFEDDE